MNDQMAKEIKFHFFMGNSWKQHLSISALIFSGFLLLGPTYLWISSQEIAPMPMLELSEWSTQTIYTKFSKI